MNVNEFIKTGMTGDVSKRRSPGLREQLKNDAFYNAVVKEVDKKIEEDKYQRMLQDNNKAEKEAIIEGTKIADDFEKEEHQELLIDEYIDELKFTLHIRYNQLKDSKEGYPGSYGSFVFAMMCSYYEDILLDMGNILSLKDYPYNSADNNFPEFWEAFTTVLKQKVKEGYIISYDTLGQIEDYLPENSTTSFIPPKKTINEKPETGSYAVYYGVEVSI